MCVFVCLVGVVCEDVRGEGDGKSSEVNAGTPPPSKKMKDGNKPDEPIEGQSSNFEFKLKTIPRVHTCCRRNRQSCTGPAHHLCCQGNKKTNEEVGENSGE